MERIGHPEQFARDQLVARVVDAAAAACEIPAAAVLAPDDPGPHRLVRGTGTSAHRLARQVTAYTLHERFGLDPAGIADVLGIDAAAVDEILFNAEWGLQHNNQTRIHQAVTERLTD